MKWKEVLCLLSRLLVCLSFISVVNDWDCDIILLGLNLQFYSVVYIYVKYLGFFILLGRIWLSTGFVGLLPLTANRGRTLLCVMAGLKIDRRLQETCFPIGNCQNLPIRFYCIIDGTCCRFYIYNFYVFIWSEHTMWKQYVEKTQLCTLNCI